MLTSEHVQSEEEGNSRAPLPSPLWDVVVLRVVRGDSLQAWVNQQLQVSKMYSVNLLLRWLAKKHSHDCKSFQPCCSKVPVYAQFQGHKGYKVSFDWCLATWFNYLPVLGEAERKIPFSTIMIIFVLADAGQRSLHVFLWWRKKGFANWTGMLSFKKLNYANWWLLRVLWIECHKLQITFVAWKERLLILSSFVALTNSTEN